MRKLLTALAIPALALTMPGLATAETRAEKGEARLAKMLEGRTAGEPVSCISTLRSSGLETIDNTAVVYDGGKTIYVARPTNPKDLGPWDIVVIKRTNGSQLCANDIIYTVDQGTGFRTGAIFLNDFVPYTKAD
jgi:hypothetical protein